MGESQVDQKQDVSPDAQPGGSSNRFALGWVASFLIFVAVGVGLAFFLLTIPSVRSFLGGEPRPLPVYWKIPNFSLIERSGKRVTLADLQGKIWIANFIYTHCPDTCPFQTAELAKLHKEFADEKDLRFVSITVDPENDTPEDLVRYADAFSADPERWFFLTGDKEAIYRLALKGFRLSVADPGEGVQRPSSRFISPGGGFEGPHPSHAQLKRLREPRPLAAILEFLGGLLEPAVALAHVGHPGKPFIHSSRFVLIDQNARVRGFYGAIVPPSVQGQSGSPYVIDQEVLQRLRRDVRGLLQEK